MKQIFSIFLGSLFGAGLASAGEPQFHPGHMLLGVVLGAILGRNLYVIRLTINPVRAVITGGNTYNTYCITGIFLIFGVVAVFGRILRSMQLSSDQAFHLQLLILLFGLSVMSLGIAALLELAERAWRHNPSRDTAAMQISD